MMGFRRVRSLQEFASLHGSIHNHSNQERHITSRQIYKAPRDAALDTWRALGIDSTKLGLGAIRNFSGQSDSTHPALSLQPALIPLSNGIIHVPVK